MSRVLPRWDQHVLRAAKLGDEAAVRLLMDNVRRMAFATAMRKLGSVDDAADIAQEAALRVHAHLSEFDAQRALRPWVSRITTNLCADLVRARRRRPESELEDDGGDALCPEAGVHDLLERSLEAERIREAVERLPDPYRSAIRLRFFEDLAVDEIATRMSVPEGTVKSWLFRARRQLSSDPNILALATV